MTRPGLKKRTKKGLTRKCHAHVGVRVLIIDAQVIHIGTRGLPARIFEGDLPGGDKAGREAGRRREVGGRPARPAELAIETAANQGVSENRGTGSAAALDVEAGRCSIQWVSRSINRDGQGSGRPGQPGAARRELWA